MFRFSKHNTTQYEEWLEVVAVIVLCIMNYEYSIETIDDGGWHIKPRVLHHNLAILHHNGDCFLTAHLAHAICHHHHHRLHQGTVEGIERAKEEEEGER